MHGVIALSSRGCICSNDHRCLYSNGIEYSKDFLLPYVTNLSEHLTQIPMEFDVIFGPAYKGIPLCAIASVSLARLSPIDFGNKEWCFNRKEAKDHGERGMLVGAEMKGKRVLVIDDVITNGAAKREAVSIIQAAGGVLAGMIVAVDRQETISDSAVGDRMSALGALRKEYGVPMVAIITLGDIVQYSKGRLGEADMSALRAYRERYGSADALAQPV